MTGGKRWHTLLFSLWLTHKFKEHFSSEEVTYKYLYIITHGAHTFLIAFQRRARLFLCKPAEGRWERAREAAAGMKPGTWSTHTHTHT